MNTILIRDGLLVEANRSWHADILIEGEKISRVESRIDLDELPKDTTIVNAEGMCILPGLIDAHTHYHLVSRGTVTADSFAEGSRAAAYGGVTTVIDFADHDKESPLVVSSEERIKAMEEGMEIDFALHQGIYGIPQNLKEELQSVKERGITALKIFTTYKDVGYLIEQEGLKELFEAAKELSLLVSIHCEDDTLIEKIGESYKGDYKAADHPLLRPAEAEYKAIMAMGELAKEVDIPLYIVHLSSARGLEAVRTLRAQGVTLMVETTPHYLLLDNSYLEGEEAPLYVMTPPLRGKKDKLILQDALVAKEIQVVATDHCTFTKEQKSASKDCRTIYPGVPGTEELLPLVHTFAVASGRMSLSHMVRLLSTAPAKTFGLYPQKGSLEVGSDADIVIFDSEHLWTLSADNLHSAAGYTPYEGFRVVGKAIMTYLRGRLVMGDGIYLEKKGSGQFVEAQESLVFKGFR